MSAIAAILLSALLTLCKSLSLPPRDHHPQIIAHRGASGYLPEHSIPAYKLAIDLGTDYIEPDLCLSKDGVFVAMHDLLLDDTTNVASLPQFQDRLTTKIVDGQNLTGYFISDFLYAELQEIRLVQRLPERSTLYNGIFQIPNLSQIVNLVLGEYNSSGIIRGIYPELKHPTYFASLGFDMASMLLQSLSELGYDTKGINVAKNLSQVLPVVIQCFEKSTLRDLKGKTDIPLVYLVDDPSEMDWVLNNVAETLSFADALGPNKIFLGSIPLDAGKKVVESLRKAGLALHPWTFRADQDILPKFGTNFAEEQMYFIACLGVDAIFTEFPDRTRQSVDAFNNITSNEGGLNFLQMKCKF